MLIVKSHQEKHLKNMSQSQNECSRLRLNKTLLVKLDCDFTE